MNAHLRTFIDLAFVVLVSIVLMAIPPLAPFVTYTTSQAGNFVILTSSQIACLALLRANQQERR